MARAVDLLAGAQRPVIIAGNGARPFRQEVIALAEHLDAPVITTVDGRGAIPEDHRLCGQPWDSEHVVLASMWVGGGQQSSRGSWIADSTSFSTSRCTTFPPPWRRHRAFRYSAAILVPVRQKEDLMSDYPDLVTRRIVDSPIRMPW